MAANADQQRVSVIMAGGSGERFWPLSRHNRPKQLLCLTSAEKTMLEEAVDRIAPLIPREHVYVITAEHLVEPIRDEGVGIPPENVVAEPCKRNTAGCLIYAAAHLLAKYGLEPAQMTMSVTTADHIIGEPDRFRACVETAMDTAERDDCLVTLGMTPTRPETGYGYIQIGNPIDSPSDVPVYRVAAFHEKPNREKAEEFIEQGNYFWNGGMFFWKLSTFLEELHRARPEFAEVAHAITEALRAKDDGAAAAAFESLESISIDYALMEKASRVAMVRADFPWDDVGAWPSLERSHKADAAGNVALGNPVLYDCENCIVYNETGDEMAVSVVGAQDLVVIVTRDAVLVIPKDRAQDVRHAVDALRKRDARQV